MIEPTTSPNLRNEWLKLLKKAAQSSSNISSLDQWCRKQNFYGSEAVEDIVGLLKAVSIHQKVNLWYLIDVMVTSSQGCGAYDFGIGILKNVLSIIYAVAPIDHPQGFINLWNLQIVLESWRRKRVFAEKELDLINAHFLNLRAAHELADASLGPRLQKIERIRARTQHLGVATAPSGPEKQLSETSLSHTSTYVPPNLPSDSSTADVSVAAPSNNNCAGSIDSKSVTEPTTPARATHGHSTRTGNTMLGFYPILHIPPFNGEISSRLEADRDFSKRIREIAWARPPNDTDAAEFSRAFDKIAPYPIDSKDVEALIASNKRFSRGSFFDVAEFEDNGRKLLNYQDGKVLM